MHDQPIEAGDAAANDLRDQAAVLAHLLSLHPQSLTIAELIRELSGERAGFAERDRINRAVRDLVGVGLLRTVCELVQPTRAAVAFHEIRREE
jgi:hypothetical protein